MLFRSLRGTFYLLQTFTIHNS